MCLPLPTSTFFYGLCVNRTCTRATGARANVKNHAVGHGIFVFLVMFSFGCGWPRESQRRLLWFHLIGNTGQTRLPTYTRRARWPKISSVKTTIFRPFPFSQNLRFFFIFSFCFIGGWWCLSARHKEHNWILVTHHSWLHWPTIGGTLSRPVLSRSTMVEKRIK